MQVNVQSVKMKYINTSFQSCNSLYSIDCTATVPALPEGYSYAFIPINGYRSVTKMTGLSGTTATFNVTNINNAAQNVNAQGVLMYYPTSWEV